MDELPIIKKKEKRNWTVGSLALAGLAAVALAYGCSPKEKYTIENATYQGYRATHEGSSMLVFDNEPKSTRQGEPEHRIFGDPNRLGLEIGRTYDIRVRVPRWFQEKITSATPVD